MELKRCPNIRSVQYCNCKDGECSVTKLFEEKRKADDKISQERRLEIQSWVDRWKRLESPPEMAIKIWSEFLNR
jgi:hypothetical protein